MTGSSIGVPTYHATARPLVLPSVADRPPIRHRAMIHLEPQPLVQPERPGRILGIDPEHRLGHAGGAIRRIASA